MMLLFRLDNLKSLHMNNVVFLDRHGFRDLLVAASNSVVKLDIYAVKSRVNRATDTSLEEALRRRPMTRLEKFNMTPITQFAITDRPLLVYFTSQR